MCHITHSKKGIEGGTCRRQRIDRIRSFRIWFIFCVPLASFSLISRFFIDSQILSYIPWIIHIYCTVIFRYEQYSYVCIPRLVATVLVLLSEVDSISLSHWTVNDCKYKFQPPQPTFYGCASQKKLNEKLLIIPRLRLGVSLRVFSSC